MDAASTKTDRPADPYEALLAEAAKIRGVSLWMDSWRSLRKNWAAMISLGAVEMMVKQLWPGADHAAIAVPDKRRGERIVLVTTQSLARKDELIAYAKRFGATEMMIPDDIVNVPEIPVLGSGKVDYAATAQLVAGTVTV